LIYALYFVYVIALGESISKLILSC